MAARARCGEEDRRCRYVLAFDCEILNRSKSIRRIVEDSGLSLDHGPERDRIPGLLDGGDAVLPYLPGGAGHHVERPRRGVECEAPPLFPLGFPEAELARPSQ